MDAEDLLAFSRQAAVVGIGLWGAVVLIAGEEYPGAVTDPRGAPLLVDGGEMDQGELVARILKEDLPERPALQGDLQWKREGEADWRETVWRIAEVQGNEVDAVWAIRCVVKN